MMKTNWLDINLLNPLVMASITPISHATIKEHIKFYKNAEEYGIGAVVLPSINPTYTGSNENIHYVQNDILAHKSGLNNKYDSMMSISLIGPPFPNLTSVEY